MITAIEMVGGKNIFYSHSIVGTSYEVATKESVLAAKEANLAVLLLMNADPTRYGELATN